MNRVFLFSDPSIIQRLQTDFIPYAGNTHELQNARSLTRDWFVKTASQVNARVPVNDTAQGFYVIGPDGSAYGFINHHHVDRVHRFLDEAMQKYRRNPPRQVAIAESDIAAPFVKTPPPTASVLRVFSRIQPMPPNVSDLNRGVGRDHLWVYAEEAQAILAEAEAGKTAFPLPRTLTARLVRFHLLDNVRGEPDMWRPDQVKKAEFLVQPLGKSANRRTFRLMGTYAMALPDNQRGLEGKLTGEFTLDTRSGKIVRFRAYGEAQAWGRATYTPDPPPGRFPLKFAIVETNDAVSKIVAPQAVSIGEPYHDPRL